MLVARCVKRHPSAVGQLYERIHDHRSCGSSRAETYPRMRTKQSCICAFAGVVARCSVHVKIGRPSAACTHTKSHTSYSCCPHLTKIALNSSCRRQTWHACPRLVTLAVTGHNVQEIRNIGDSYISILKTRLLKLGQKVFWGYLTNL